MQENQTDLLTDELIQENGIPRKKMLPVWIKIFTWIFLVISVFAVYSGHVDPPFRDVDPPA